MVVVVVLNLVWHKNQITSMMIDVHESKPTFLFCFGYIPRSFVSPYIRRIYTRMITTNITYYYNAL